MKSSTKYILTTVVMLSLLIYFSSCKNVKQISEAERVNIKKELLEMVTIDQIAASPRQGIYKTYSTEKWQNFKDSVFTSHKEKLDVYYQKYGFLGYDMVGKEGATHFWLLVQHCDQFPDFQKQILKDMEKAVKKGKANAENFAYLFDRVQVNANKKQRFGTQVTYEVQTTGRAFPKIGLLDSARVDQLRLEFGLTPLKEYLNQMTTMHYEMNKDSYLKKGVSSPNLYH